jgi:hypothetical protein
MPASQSVIPPLALEALSLNREGTAFASRLQAFCERILTPSAREHAKRFEDATSQKNSAETLRNGRTTRVGASSRPRGGRMSSEARAMTPFDKTSPRNSPGCSSGSSLTSVGPTG